MKQLNPPGKSVKFVQFHHQKQAWRGLKFDTQLEGLGKNFASWLIFQQCHASQCFDGFWVPNMSRRCLAYVEEPLETGA